MSENNSENGQVTDEMVNSVLEHYGRTMYYVQMLEYEFKFILQMEKTKKISKFSKLDKEFKKLINDIHNKTLGQMVVQFCILFDVPEEIKNYLKIWNKSRNFLAHDFFSVKAQEFKTKSGCSEMICKLNFYTEIFKFAWKYMKELNKTFYMYGLFSNIETKSIIEEYLLESLPRRK